MDKEELKRHRWLRKRIEQYKNKLRELEAIATKQTAVINDQPKGSDGSDKRIDAIMDMVSITKELNDLICESAQITMQIEKAIARLPEREQSVVWARYVEDKEFEQIAVDMSYSWQHIHRIHANALSLLQGRKHA